MKVDLVIHSSDSNPFYLDFWPLVSKVWKVRFNIEPLLVFVGEDDVPIDETYGRVIRMKPLPDLPLYLQCQWVRFWIPTQFPDKVCLISDIDMFPISKAYFVDQLAPLSSHVYVHLNPDHTYLPVCYHVAKGRMFKEILAIDDEWEVSMRRFASLNLGHDCTADDPTNPMLRDKPNWGAEEEYITQKIRAYPNPAAFVFLTRRHSRLDRSYWVWTPEDIRSDRFADAHSIRPYSQYKAHIDAFTNALL